jgi:hypothetical protein
VETICFFATDAEKQANHFILFYGALKKKPVPNKIQQKWEDVNDSIGLGGLNESRWGSQAQIHLVLVLKATSAIIKGFRKPPLTKQYVF